MKPARISPGTPLQPLLDAGGELWLEEGTWTGPFVLRASVSVHGLPGTVLDSQGRGPVLEVPGDDLEVRLEGLTLRGGHGDGGGGVRLTGWSRLELVGCAVLECVAPGNTGGGALALRGALELRRCTFLGNRATAGSDVVATGASELTVEGGRFAGDLAAREGARVRLSGVTLDGALDLRGTTTRAPTVWHDGCVFGGGIRNDTAHPGMLIAEEES